jgi:ABC-type dipeptide/oligopeptide/nickel transport system permease subunit
MPRMAIALDAAPGRRRTRASGVLGWIGGAVVALTFLACVATIPYTFGRVASPGGDAADGGARARLRRYEASDLEHALLPPAFARADGSHGGGAVHLLGTDRLGRDLLVRCLAGGGISLAIGFAAAAVAVVIGTTYGTISGYAGGTCDAVMMRVLDILYGLPSILLVVLLAVAVEGIVARSVQEISPGARQVINVCTLLAAIGGVTWLTMARVIRGQVLSLKQQPFMEACRATGVPLGRQIRLHLLPNLVGPIIVYATLAIPSAMLAESFLSFLGIGVREPLPSWGNLVAEGLGELNVVRSRWWLLLFPCLFIAMTLLAMNFVGEALREAMDPKRR